MKEVKLCRCFADMNISIANTLLELRACRAYYMCASFAAAEREGTAG